MPPIVPVGQSPGKIRVLWLNEQGVRHSVSVNLVTGTAPTTHAEAETYGTTLANEVAGMLNTQACQLVDSWQFIGPEGHILAAGALDDIVGALALEDGLADSQSSTVAFLGYATGSALTEQIGLSKVTVYTGSTYAIPGGAATLPADPTADWQQFRAFLNSSAWAGADFYGRKCEWRPYVALQYNARLQKKYGA